MTDIDISDTRELHVSVTSNLQIRKIEIFPKIEFFRSFSLKNDVYVCEMPLSFEKNVRGKLGKCHHLKAFAKKKCIFRLLKVSFEAPPRFCFNFFYNL